jgi:hypothetical protein
MSKHHQFENILPKLESTDPDDYKSQCNYCKREFNCHPRSHGTSSMLQHIRKSCKKSPNRFDKTQSKLSFEAKREGQAAMGEGSSGNLVLAKFNASKIRAALSRMSCHLDLWKVKGLRTL